MTPVFCRYAGGNCLELRVYLGQTTSLEAVTLANALLASEASRVVDTPLCAIINGKRTPGAYVTVTHQGVTVLAHVGIDGTTACALYHNGGGIGTVCAEYGWRECKGSSHALNDPTSDQV